MMQFIKNIFDSTPGSECNYYIPLIILASLLILGSITFSFIYKKKKKTDFAFKRLFKNTSKTLMILGIVLSILILIRYENIPYFAMRLWLYILIIVAAVLIIRYIKIFFTKYPKEKENLEYKQKHTSTKTTPKYLPNKRSKGKKKKKKK